MSAKEFCLIMHSSHYNLCIICDFSTIINNIIVIISIKLSVYIFIDFLDLSQKEEWLSILRTPTCARHSSL